MPITIYKADTINPEIKKKLFARSMANYQTIINQIKPTVADVKERKDAPIFEKYRHRNTPIKSLKVSSQEFERAKKQITAQFKKAVRQAILNIKKVHYTQRQSIDESTTFVFTKSNDIKVWRKWRPIESVGLYVPGGKANYPSSLLMSVIPAQVAGCKQIVVCVPPDNKTGTLPPEVLYAARQLKIKNLFKVGGPQAIAAMAYGTESIPQVDKIVGPGNQYVTAAKLLLFPKVDIDCPAGPSENLIIADKYANPTFVAADLITDAEHGFDSTSLLVTDSALLASEVKQQIKIILSNLETQQTIRKSLNNFGAIIITKNIAEAITIANKYAPEHIQIMTQNAAQVAKKIRNAGSVFVGKWTSKAAGDYATGANHILPTGQMARMFGPLSVESFGRLLQFQQTTKQGLAALKQTIETFASVEKLPAHKISTNIRFNKQVSNQ